MGKLDLNLFTFLNKNDFRTLNAIELGMKNHEFVPIPIISTYVSIKGSNLYNTLKNLCRLKYIAYEKSGQGDGYRLNYNGYDILALDALVKRGSISDFGTKIGVGKESDVYVGHNDQGQKVAIKFHRLGRTSFRKIKEKRDYHGKRKHASWLYLSRLAAQREFEFMHILQLNNFPVPKALDQNRHCVVMELIDGYPLTSIKDISDPELLYEECIELMIKVANFGLIHADFNEFNIMFRNENSSEKDRIVLIDFPQMIPIEHSSAEEQFNRDAVCLFNFFKRRFSFEAKCVPTFHEVVVEKGLLNIVSAFRKQFDSKTKKEKGILSNYEITQVEKETSDLHSNESDESEFFSCEENQGTTANFDENVNKPVLNTIDDEEVLTRLKKTIKQKQRSKQIKNGVKLTRKQVKAKTKSSLKEIGLD